MRGFFAINLPEAVQSALSSWALDGATIARAAGLRPRPVDAANMHITVRFLGEVSEQAFCELCDSGLKETLASLDLGPISLRGIGAFPNVLHPRVVWAGVSDGREGLSKLHAAVEAFLSSVGFTADAERYHPHATLFRLADGQPSANRALSSWMEDAREVRFGTVGVWNLTLFRSVLTSQGPIYRALTTIPIGGSEARHG